ncbi:TIGR03943 family putative permease subunit [Streptomyces sp. 142MFCol3.1]|uniref:TIGR03943 family putative permease subunit n=1 Tax=Streptomyces sp. 142MFCol3.1 TaxID=1172179 RepID=UPI0004187E82|nr:TIGR03943 family protein [Streptomyces sp. 142MFCol3.1]
MNRQAQAAVLFLVGAAVLHAGATDLYLRYVKAGLRPMLLGAGVVLIAAAVATVWYEMRERGFPWRRGARAARDAGHVHEAGHTDGSRHERTLAADADGRHERTAIDADADGHGHGQAALDASGHADDHGHSHREPLVSWLLVLPLLALILVAPPALGSYSALRTGTALQKPLAYPPLGDRDPLPMGLVDYAGRAAYDHGRSLAGRHIRITGFVALDHAGRPYLVRMALNCCAADAQPVKIGLTGRIPPVLRPDGWLEVTGTYTGRRSKDPVNGGVIPFLDVSSAKPVQSPRDPYDESWNN